MRNGIPVAALSEFVDEVRQHPEEGRARYGVSLTWETGTRSRVRTLPMMLGSHRLQRDYSWVIDEPRQLLGLNHGPNPQEYLLSGLGGCILVGFAVGASVLGIQLERLEVQVEGELDLAGFLGVSESASVPLRGIRYRIHVAGDATPEQLALLHEKAVSHSPNAMSLARGVPLSGELVILERSCSAEATHRRATPS